MTAKSAQAKTATPKVVQPAGTASAEREATLAQISEHQVAIGGELTDRNNKGKTVASRVAKKLNGARRFPCPTADGRENQGFAYWIGACVEAFVAKHS